MNFTLKTKCFRRRASSWMLSLSVIAIAFGHTLDQAAASDKYCSPEVSNAPIYWNLERLAGVKTDLNEAGAKSIYKPAYRDVIEDAKRALKKKPYTVTDKSRAGPSGDLRDYVSLSRYWWANPNTEDGLPYIRKDGQSNPERKDDIFDRMRSQRMTSDVTALSMAAYLTGEQKYADQAKKFMQVWFIDEDTRMNPHLRYAQSVPGREDGRLYGILDGRIYWNVIDSALLLQSVGMIDEEFVNSLRLWFGSYAAWLITDDFGKGARARKNNHGTFYDAQLSHILLFAGRCDLARNVLKGVKTRVKSQIDASGLQPEEKKRTQSLHYHAFNLEAFLRIASLAKKLDIELYDKRKGGSGSIKDGVHFIASYADRIDEWPYQEINKSVEKSVWSMLMHAQLLDESDVVDQALDKLDYDDPDNLLMITTGS